MSLPFNIISADGNPADSVYLLPAEIADRLRSARAATDIVAVTAEVEKPCARVRKNHNQAGWIMSDDVCPDWKDGRHFYRDGFIGSDGRFYRLEDAEHVPGGMVYAGKRCVCGKTVQGPSVQPRISDRSGKY